MWLESILYSEGIKEDIGCVCGGGGGKGWEFLGSLEGCELERYINGIATAEGG